MMHRTPVLLVVVAALIACCAASCSNGVAAGANCLCYDGFSGASCASIAELSSCSKAVATAATDRTTPVAPTLGGGISGTDFKIVVNFSPLVATRYVQRVQYTAADNSNAFTYPGSKWGVTGITTGCKEVYTATMDKDAAATAGVFIVDHSNPSLETYSGTVYITAVDQLSDGSLRTITYKIPFKYSFPVASATMVSAQISSDPDVNADIAQVTAVTAAANGDIGVTVKIATKYPYMLNYLTLVGSPAFVGSDLTSDVSAGTSGYRVTRGAAPAQTCTNNANSRCAQDFSFTITPGTKCSVDGRYTVHAAASKCIGDSASSCVQQNDGSWVEKDVVVDLDLVFGNLCGLSDVFQLLTSSPTLNVNPDAARTKSKTSFVQGVDNNMYFSTIFDKSATSIGAISSVSLTSVETRCTSIGCEDKSSYSPVLVANVVTETPPTVNALWFNLPVSLFLHAATTTAYAFNWDIKATAVVYFSVDAGRRREVFHIRAALSSMGGSSSGQFVIVKPTNDTQIITSTSTPTPNSITPTFTPTPTPASVITPTEKSGNDMSLIGLIGIIVGAVCLAGLLVVLVILVVRRRNKKNKKEQVSEGEESESELAATSV